MKGKKSIHQFCVVGLCCGIFFGCHPTDYSVQLPNGYSVVRVNSDKLLIADARPVVVVPPSVKEMGVTGNLVYGRVSRPSVLDPNLKTITGYFVVDTRTGGVMLGMEENAWLRRLRDSGINERPILRRPTRFAKFL